MEGLIALAVGQGVGVSCMAVGVDILGIVAVVVGDAWKTQIGSGREVEWSV